MNTEKQHILLVEDEAPIRKFLRISLESQGYRVHEARLAEDGLAQCASLQPNLIILDLGLPDMDGQQFIAQVREWSHIPIIVLSVRATEKEKVKALDAGANDYMTKPFGISEFMARIRAVLRNVDPGVVSPTVFEGQGLKIDFSQRQVSVDGQHVHLSKKEYELLRLLVARSGQVLTHQHILKEIWGGTYQSQTHYLRVLVRQLRQKLGDDPVSPRFIITVQGIGYRFVGSP